MTKRRKDILKRKYIAPEVYFEQTEPWEMIAATGAEVDAGDMSGTGGGSGNDGENGGPPEDDDAKFNNIWFNDDFEDFE